MHLTLYKNSDWTQTKTPIVLCTDQEDYNDQKFSCPQEYNDMEVRKMAP